MRMLTGPLGSEQVAISWRRMPAGSGGRGSYGHFHKTQEEILYVISGRLQAKLDDDVIELSPGQAVRIAPQCVRSVHNDGPEDVEIVLVSVRLDDVRGDVDMVPDFWPE
jgi:quercetin dioxygenase-like cupin family protein